MENIPNKNEKELFEVRLNQLKKLWDLLHTLEFEIEGKKQIRTDLMPFEFIEKDLRDGRPVPIFQSFGGSGCRVSRHPEDGLRIWFTNSFLESNAFRESKEKILSLWEALKKN